MDNKNKKANEFKSAYNQEFRETAIKLALVGNKPTAEVARELGVSHRLLYGWVSAWKKKNGENTGTKGKNSAEEELRKLQNRLKEVELENEILKKAAAYFAKTLL
jgi:transposase